MSGTTFTNTTSSAARSTDDTNDYRITVLGEDNYVTWKWQVTMVLTTKGLYECVTGTNSDVSKNRQAATFLASVLSQQNMQRVINCTTAQEIWTALEANFENKSSTERAMLMEKFTSFKINSLHNISKDIGEVQALAAKLKSLGAHVDDEFIVSIILKALPDSMKTWKSTWKMVNAKELKLNALVTGIMAEVNEMKVPEDAAFIARDRPRLGRPGGGNNRRFAHMDSAGESGFYDRKGTCHYCRMPGHWIKDCRKRQADERNSGKTSYNQQGVAMMGIAGATSLETTHWIADSGSTFHMTPNKSWIREYSPFYEDKQITLGDDRRIPAKGSGTIKTSFGELRDVHYVPNLSANLFSIATAASRGIEARYDKDGIQLIKDNQIVLTGGKTQGVYALNFGIEHEEGRALVAGTLKEWHNKFGHVAIDTIRRMAKFNIVEDLEIKEDHDSHDQCIECAICKCKRVSHPDRSTKRTDKAGASLHFDTVGPFKQESLGGSKYIVVCKDEASAYRIAKAVAEKTEITNHVKGIISQAEIETGSKVLRVVTDNGSEFMNKNLREFLEDRGICHKTSAPYTPQQNGLIEREVRTIVEAARTLLRSSKLPLSLWAEAVNTATYVLNRTINSMNPSKTPYELWFGKKPSVKNLHKFGQNAIVIYRDHQRSKWDSKGVKQNFVGYTQVFNTFRFYDHTTDQVYISCDAVFTENCEDAEEGKEPEEETWTLREQNTQIGDKVDRTIDVSDELSWDHGPLDLVGNCFTQPVTSTPHQNSRDTAKDLPEKEMEKQTDEGVSTPRQEAHQSDIQESVEVDQQQNLPHKQGQPVCERRSVVVGPIRHYKKKDHLKRASEKVYPSDIHPKHEIPARLRSDAKDRYHAKLAAIRAEEDPISYEEAMNRSDRDMWLQAMNEEIESLNKNQVYDLVDRPECNVVTNKWVFKIKRNSIGQVERYKARLVARGFTQVYGIDYLETYAPVANMTSIRMIFAYAAMEGLHISQFDIKTAFLYGELDETVYMEQPEGFCRDSSKVCLLKRSLYGLKQSPRQWNIKFSDFLKEMDLSVSEHDNCVFYRRDPMLILAIYVDDGLIFARDKQVIDRTIKQLKGRFDVHLVESSTFLGFQIHRGTDGEICLHQNSYINAILRRFNMEDAKPVESPTSISKITEDLHQPLDTKIPYREAIGSLMYAAVMTRVDIAHAVCKASRHVESPTNQDWMAVKRIFRYLKGKENYALEYKKTNNREMTVYCDADFAGDSDTGRSTTGSVFIYGGAPIQWKSQRQSLITLSSTEAEFVSLCSTVKETVWIRKLAYELDLIDPRPTIIYCDNQSAIKIATNEKSCHRTRHMHVQASYPREQAENGEIELHFVKSEDQLADMLTKPTTIHKFVKNTDRIMKTALNILLIALLLIMGIGDPTEAYIFDRVNPMIWIPLENHVETNITTFNLILTYTSPCAMLDKERVHTAVDLLHKPDPEYVENLKSSCDMLFNEKWEEKTRMLAEMKPPNLETEAIRKKRFIDPISLGIGSAIGVIMVGNLVSSFLSEVVPWGDGYRIRELQKQAELEQERLRILEEKVDSMKIMQDKLEAKLDSISQKVYLNTQHIGLIEKTLPMIAWKSAYIQDTIAEAGFRLERIMHGYRRGQAEMFDIGMLWNITYFKTIDSTDTLMTNVTRIAPSTLYMKILVKNKSQDTKAYNIHTFDYLDNLLTEPVMLKYQGPKHILYNTTSKCTIAIDEPRFQQTVQDSCCSVNWVDPKLNNWARVTVNATAKLRPQVKRVHLWNYIYCIGNNITIDGEVMKCPIYPFKLPLTNSFKTFGHDYVAHVVKINSGGPHWETLDTALPNSLIPEQELSELHLLESADRIRRERLEIEAQKDKYLAIPKETVPGIAAFTVSLILIMIYIKVTSYMTNNKRQELERSQSERKLLMTTPTTKIQSIHVPSEDRSQIYEKLTEPLETATSNTL